MNPLRRSAMPLRSLLGLVLAGALAGPALAQPDAPPVRGLQKPASAERVPAKLVRLASLLGRDGDVRIVAFGSSSTEGAGASSPAMAYPALLERDLEDRLQIGAASRRSITVVNRGKGGDTAEEMARRLERDVLAERPDLVVWQIGPDGLHMTDAGYRQLAKAAAAQILVGAGLIQPSLARN